MKVTKYPVKCPVCEGKVVTPKCPSCKDGIIWASETDYSSADDNPSLEPWYVFYGDTNPYRPYWPSAPVLPLTWCSSDTTDIAESLLKSCFGNGECQQK